MEKKSLTRRQLRVYDWKCIGCMACSSACPEGAITLTDLETRRILRFGYTCERRECARCVDACPEGILSLTETVEDTVGHGSLVLFFEMISCVRCGEPLTSQRLLDNLSNRLPAFLKCDGAEPAWFRLCPECRRYEEAEAVSPSMPLRKHDAEKSIA